MGVSTNAGHAHPHAGVVHEHIQPPVAIAVRGDDLLDLGLISDIRSNGLHVEPLRREALDGRLELLGPARRHGDGEPLLCEHLGDGQSDAARCSRDDRCARC
jgi:hypothetical protein